MKRGMNLRRPMLVLSLLTAAFLLAFPAAVQLAHAEDAHASDATAVSQTDDHAQPDDSGHGEGPAHSEPHGDADPHGDDIHGGEHGEEHHAEHGEHVELPHTLMLLRALGIIPKYDHAKVEAGGSYLTSGAGIGAWVHVFENTFFALLASLVISLVSITVYNKREVLPGRLQALVELIVENVDNMMTTIMGPIGRNYTPFVGTIFVYLLCMNYSGLIPLGKASTSTFLNNFSVALIVFLFVQYTGIRKNGIGGYLHHLCGSPKDITGWLLAPLMLFLELFGELIKPVSLSLRLFGNIFGEDMLLVIFALLGVVLVSVLGIPGLDGNVGIPLHLPFLMLSMLLGFIQAMVFSLLAAVYISMMLPHDDHH